MVNQFGLMDKLGRQTLTAPARASEGAQVGNRARPRVVQYAWRG